MHQGVFIMSLIRAGHPLAGEEGVLVQEVSSPPVVSLLSQRAWE